MSFCLNSAKNKLKLSPMTDDKKQKQQTIQTAQKLKSAAKQAQLSEALRANLRRRKEQARVRKKTVDN